MTINVLAVGDVVGTVGLDTLADSLRSIKKLKNISFTVVNGENASGVGITPRQAEEIFDAGADVITLGNHSFARREITDYLDDSGYILRPANFAPQNPGRGWGVFDSPVGEIAVINLIGRCGMAFGPDNPFHEVDRILKQLKTKLILVDFHAEATSEKVALSCYLDGRVSAVWGTHTHVQTSDCRVSQKGTGCITDVGMTGAADSVLGVRSEQSVSMFLGNPHYRYDTASGPGKMECAVFEIDISTGRCVSAEALRIC